ncbi:MAG: DNA-binding protein Alba [Thermoplasmata archaeon]|jgi:DNA-binding protein
MTENKTEENVVFIGKKPTMNYVIAVVTQFNNGAKSVVLKARGKAIKKAVDVEEVVRNRFLSNLNINYSVALNTEKIKTDDGKESNVSSIEITLKR